MTPKSLFAVAIGSIGVWYIGECTTILLGRFIGELAYLAVGVLLLVAAALVNRNQLLK